LLHRLLQRELVTWAGMAAQMHHRADDHANAKNQHQNQKRICSSHCECLALLLVTQALSLFPVTPEAAPKYGISPHSIQNSAKIDQFKTNVKHKMLEA